MFAKVPTNGRCVKRPKQGVRSHFEFEFERHQSLMHHAFQLSFSIFVTAHRVLSLEMIARLHETMFDAGSIPEKGGMARESVAMGETILAKLQHHPWAPAR